MGIETWVFILIMSLTSCQTLSKSLNLTGELGYIHILTSHSPNTQISAHTQVLLPHILQLHLQNFPKIHTSRLKLLGKWHLLLLLKLEIYGHHDLCLRNT